MSELHDKARGLATYLSVCDGDKTSAGIVRDLLAENERLLTDLQQANATTLKAINQRMDAEARLRALCEQEPVAWLDESGDHVSLIKYGNRTIPLIPRPSMEKKS